MRLTIARTSLVLLLITGSGVEPVARAHDIPNQRVDRSIQVTLKPGRLEISYEVSLTELTLTQDLRSLIGSRPGAERSEWLELYGQVTGPMNAKGFLVSVDGSPIASPRPAIASWSRNIPGTRSSSRRRSPIGAGSRSGIELRVQRGNEPAGHPRAKGSSSTRKTGRTTSNRCRSDRSGN